MGLPGTGLWYRDTKKVGSSRTGAEYNKPMPNADDISREALEAEASLNAHTQDRDAMQEWMSQMYEWAGADLARRAQVREMVLARVRQWVQSAWTSVSATITCSAMRNRFQERSTSKLSQTRRSVKPMPS